MNNTKYTQQAIDFINQNSLTSSSSLASIKICSDTRKLSTGDVFIAYYIDSPNADITNAVCNFEHIQQAINLKASIIIADDKLTLDKNYNEYKKHIPILTLPNLYEYIGDIVSHFNDYPSTKIPIIGITGTNGKTSISTWLAQCLNALNQPTCVIGTLGTGFLGNLYNTGFTTPDAINLHYQLNEYAVQAGAKAVCMEVSSHGLKQHRVSGIKFHSAIFTNLTQDHLDYHGNLNDYINSKHLLFKKENLEYTIINTDDEIGRNFIKNTGAKHNISYTMHKQNICSNDYIFLENYRFIGSGTHTGYHIQINIKWQDAQITDNLDVNVLGKFNLYNLMAVIGGLLSMGYSWSAIKSVLSVIKSVAGRLEIVQNNNFDKLVLVDYAHTPDALEKTLNTLRPIAKERNGKLLCVFGCGGNRDKTKRPIMANIVQNNADITIITSDNPRFEEPADIINDIYAGINKDTVNSVKIIEDREEAIKYAIEIMMPQDVLLIAGKGHETYQEIKGIKHDFNDVLVTQAYLKLNYNGI